MQNGKEFNAGSFWVWKQNISMDEIKQKSCVDLSLREKLIDLLEQKKGGRSVVRCRVNWRMENSLEGESSPTFVIYEDKQREGSIFLDFRAQEIDVSERDTTGFSLIDRLDIRQDLPQEIRVC